MPPPAGARSGTGQRLFAGMRSICRRQTDGGHRAERGVRAAVRRWDGSAPAAKRRNAFFAPAGGSIVQGNRRSGPLAGASARRNAGATARPSPACAIPPHRCRAARRPAGQGFPSIVRMRLSALLPLPAPRRRRSSEDGRDDLRRHIPEAPGDDVAQHRGLALPCGSAAPSERPMLD